MEKLDFIVLYVIVMMCFGITASIFYPDQYAFGDNDYVQINEDDSPIDSDYEPSWWDNLVSAAGMFLNFFKFLWACVSFNIPYCPIIVRLLITVPFHLGMFYVIATYIRGGG